MSPRLPFHAELARLLAEGQRVAVATVVRAKGSHPRAPGAKMLVLDSGRTRFTLGGGALEASIIKDCLCALAPGGASGLHRYDLVEGGASSVGMTCGGSVEVFVEVEEPATRLVVFGAGHVGRSLAEAGHVAGLAVTVVDDRAEWLVPEAFPSGTALHRCKRDYLHDLPAVTESDCCAVMTRCHATDINVLQALHPAPLRYLGMIGSRRKVRRAFEALRGRGVSSEWLGGIRAPIGLHIGAETPGEIAIAVVAEIVAVLRGRVATSLDPAALGSGIEAAAAEEDASARSEGTVRR